MEKQKKQIILLAVFAVAALGAGSYFFLTRDTGSAASRMTRDRPAERRVRETTARDKKRGERRVKKDRREKAKVTAAERRERTATTKKKSERRTRRTTRKKVKKQEDKPAA